MKYMPIFAADNQVILHQEDYKTLKKALEVGYTEDPQLYEIIQMQGLSDKIKFKEKE